MTDPSGGTEGGERPWPSLAATVAAYRPADAVEAADTARVAALVAGADPWGRHQPLHVTCSALIVAPERAEVLLRWHDRLDRWLHVGGHGEAGEDRPFAVAQREAVEETGLDDVAAWPDPARPRLIQLVVVPVPARGDEPAHDHADLRYVLATATPERARAETPSTPLRWLTLTAARRLVGEDNLAPALQRVEAMLAAAG
jgi:8-oxo-dGTP pyrophosphatase MutT (NUDIX family)